MTSWRVIRSNLISFLKFYQLYSVVSIKQAGLLNYFESPPSPDCIFLCNKQYENPPSPLVLLFHVVKSEIIILASVLTFTKGECHSYLKEIGQTITGSSRRASTIDRQDLCSTHCRCANVQNRK